MILDKNILIILPILLPLLAAIVMLFARKNLSLQKGINITSTFLQLLSGIFILIYSIDFGIHSITVGSWQAPFGISLVYDTFTGIMLVMSSILSFSAAIFADNTIGWKNRQNFFYPLFQTLLMGVNGSFLTGDVFNLYVWFEVMLMSSFVLISLGGRQEQLEGGMKYVTINLISSTIFLTAAGITYGYAGSLNMADLAQKFSLVGDNGIISILAILFLISFGIKSAIFPLFFWLPASYHTPPVAVSALFAGLLTKVGVYVLYRFYTLIFVHNVEFIHSIILILSGFTMLVGVLGAIAQNDFRRILSFHIVSQVGYMLFALGMLTQSAIAAGIYYIIYHMIVKTNLFFTSGIVYKIKGSYSLNELGGIYKKYPIVSIIFLFSAFALSGIPPLAGFWAKLSVAFVGIDNHQYLLVGASLLAGILTLVSMTKIWNFVFWKDSATDEINECEDKFIKFSFKERFSLYFPSFLLLLLIIVFSVFISPIYNVAEIAASQLMNPDIYINAVLGAGK